MKKINNNEIYFFDSATAKKYPKLKYSSLLTRIKNSPESFFLDRFQDIYTKILDRRSGDGFIILNHVINVRNDIIDRIKNGNN